MGLHGLNIISSKGLPVRPLRGVKGIVIVSDANLFVRITDEQGNALFNVRAEILETGEFFRGDRQGNMALAVSSTATIVFTKESMTPVVLNYDSATMAINQTVIMDDNLLR